MNLVFCILCVALSVVFAFVETHSFAIGVRISAIVIGLIINL